MKLWPFGRRKPVAAPRDDLPIPTYLKQFLVPDQKCSMKEITGSIRCTCGCTAFAAHRSMDDNRLYHLTCSTCGQDILLFDGQRYGWDALVCGFHMADAQVGECTEKCGKCGCGEFHATVWYEPTEREEYISCSHDGLNESEWVNAFTWFAAHLTCGRCGHRARDWADVETA